MFLGPIFCYRISKWLIPSFRNMGTRIFHFSRFQILRFAKIVCFQIIQFFLILFEVLLHKIATQLHSHRATEIHSHTKDSTKGGGRRPPRFVEAARGHLLCGYVSMWLCGSVAMQLCSYVAIWLCGYVAKFNVLNLKFSVFKIPECPVSFFQIFSFFNSQSSNFHMFKFSHFKHF